jgi:hypothetical protein
MNDNYWKKENPEYLKILWEINTIEGRIESGLITNERTLRYRNKDLKRLRKQLEETERYIDDNKK